MRLHKKMKETAGVINAIVIAVALMISSSGVAIASYNVSPTPGIETLTITTEVACDRKVKEIEHLNWECSSNDLPDNPPLASGEKYEYGKIKYKENTFSSGGTTNLYKDFKVDTGKISPNLEVTKSIGYTATREKGTFSHAEGVDMSLKSKGSCVYIAAGSSLSMTDVQATTETKAQMTRAPELHYEIYAGEIEGPGTPAEGILTAGMSASVENGRKRLKFSYKTTVDGTFEFYKVMYFKP